MFPCLFFIYSFFTCMTFTRCSRSDISFLLYKKHCFAHQQIYAKYFWAIIENALQSEVQSHVKSLIEINFQLLQKYFASPSVWNMAWQILVTFFSKQARLSAVRRSCSHTPENRFHNTTNFQATAAVATCVKHNVLDCSCRSWPDDWRICSL